jgi:hypothetical protein
MATDTVSYTNGAGRFFEQPTPITLCAEQSITPLGYEVSTDIGTVTVVQTRTITVVHASSASASSSLPIAPVASPSPANGQDVSVSSVVATQSTLSLLSTPGSITIPSAPVLGPVTSSALPGQTATTQVTATSKVSSPTVTSPPGTPADTLTGVAASSTVSGHQSITWCWNSNIGVLAKCDDPVATASLTAMPTIPADSPSPPLATATSTAGAHHNTAIFEPNSFVGSIIGGCIALWYVGMVIYLCFRDKFTLDKEPDQYLRAARHNTRVLAHLEEEKRRHENALMHWEEHKAMASSAPLLNPADLDQMILHNEAIEAARARQAIIDEEDAAWAAGQMSRERSVDMYLAQGGIATVSSFNFDHDNPDAVDADLDAEGYFIEPDDQDSEFEDVSSSSSGGEARQGLFYGGDGRA